MGKHSIDICRMSAETLTNAFASGELNPVEVARAALDRAAEVNDTLNAFTVIDHQGALSAAAASQQRWRAGTPSSPIDGVPTTIKDIVPCHGLDVRYGSTSTGDISGEADAPSVKNLRAAGAIIIGLTTTPEFGWKAVTDNPKDGVTRNPWDVSRTPGGSSGGAAAAAASGAGVLHLGTDGGGSIRIPAAFTGIVGHKPSFGHVAAYPPSAFGTVAHIGPMARTVGDAALMLNAMSGRDLRDWTQSPFAYSPAEVRPLNWAGKRVAYWKTPCCGGVASEISSAVEAVLKDLELAGATVTETRLPYQDQLLEIFYRHWYVGAANRLSAIDESLHHAIDPGFLSAARQGQRYSAVDRMKAEVQRAHYGSQMDQLLQDFDYLISPTVPVSPFEAGYDVPVGSGLDSWVEWSSFSFPINLSQQPACSVPCGFTPDGLPIGLQIVGARGADAEVLSAALTYQQMYPERFLLAGGSWPADLQGER